MRKRGRSIEYTERPMNRPRTEFTFPWIVAVMLLVGCSAGGEVPLPASPLQLTATARNQMVELAWSPASGVAGSDHYNIYWARSSGVTVNNGTKIERAASPYVHQSLINEEKYYYVVTSLTEVGGESNPSAESSATPQPPTFTITDDQHHDRRQKNHHHVVLDAERAALQRLHDDQIRRHPKNYKTLAVGMKFQPPPARMNNRIGLWSDRAVAAGNKHNCILKGEHMLWCWATFWISTR